MLSKEEIRRYSRHILMKEVGVEGQEKLKASSVIVIGAGGLGCPVLSYLSAAGIGKIGIVDGDVVDESNLQRQILFSVEDIGKHKTIAAIDKLKEQNPHVEFIAHTTRLTIKNALDILSNYEIVIDGSDNFSTRYLVNDSCVILKKPLVLGSIFTFEGQLSVFNYNNGPTYRCLYPDVPHKNEVPNCSETGVLGVLPGIIGTLMASECIKIVLNLGEVLSGSLLVINALSNESSKFSISKNESNSNRTLLETSYNDLCDSNESFEQKEISPIELKHLLESGEIIHLIDVREKFEYEICKIDNSVLIPLGQLAEKFNEIDPNGKVVFICHHGLRSAQAIQFMRLKGYKNLLNLSGGIHAWANEVESSMPIY